MADLLLLLALLVGGVALVTAALAIGNRLSFRIAWRNVRRGRARTVLVLLGLLIATMIISSSLVLGDTVQAVNSHFVYESDGFTDEAVYNLSPTTGYRTIPLSTFSAIRNASAADGQIAGISPEILGTVTALDRNSGVPQTGLNLVGADANTSSALGAFPLSGGGSTAGPTGSGVLLDVQAANDLGASVGDTVVVYGVHPAVVAVQGIVEDQGRGDFEGGGTIFTDLATAQALENLSGRVNVLAVTNAGSQAAGVADSDEVSARLNATLSALGIGGLYSVHEVLQDDLASAASSGSELVTLFLVLGLFSIVAGAMLIVGIFVMLAEERRGEMGMLRAIGVKRRHLVLAYYFEGLVYSAGSALAGTALGVLVALLLLRSLAQTGGNDVSNAVLLASFHVDPVSLAEAYVAGFFLTLATVAAASYRASRLNIVRAIRSIPEPAPAMSVYTGLALVGVGLLLLGGALFALTRTGSGDITVPLTAGAVALVGIALIASRFVPNRIAFSVVGAGLLAWGGYEPLHTLLLGTAHTGTIDAFFADGILMIVGAILLVLFNGDTLLAGVARLFGQKGRRVAVARVGLSYPTRRPFRSAVTLTIFCLVLFTIVGVASIGSSINADLTGDIRSESGGYTFFAASEQPIPDLPGAVANNSTLAGQFTDVVPLAAGVADVAFAGAPANYQDNVFAANGSAPGSSNFYTTNQFNFSSTLGGMSAAAVWAALESNASVAVVDHSYAPGGFQVSASTHPTLAVGARLALTDPDHGSGESVTVIGILTESFVTGVWVNPLAAGALGFVNTTAFFLTVAPGASVDGAANAAKVAFLPYGLVLYNFAQILQSSIQATEAIIQLLEAFVALGLAVGVAAMGIVALRAVVERRSEIGMLRATGFTRRMVLTAFWTEYSYVGLLGIGIGTVLGIVLDWGASLSYPGLLRFSVPGENVAIVLLIAYGLAVAAIAGPSVKAAGLPPAEAVRYTE